MFGEGDEVRVSHDDGPYAGVTAEVVASEKLGGGTRYIVRDENGALVAKTSLSEGDEENLVRSEELPEGRRYVVWLDDPNSEVVRMIHAGFMEEELEAV